jgi:hypothetical protein
MSGTKLIIFAIFLLVYTHTYSAYFGYELRSPKSALFIMAAIIFAGVGMLLEEDKKK